MPEREAKNLAASCHCPRDSIGRSLSWRIEPVGPVEEQTEAQMDGRIRTLTRIALVGVVLAMWPLAAGVQGQAAAKKWTVPRTPDGHPDLQGTWISRTATPLERPKSLEGKTLLTDAEVAQLKARAEEIFKSGHSDFASGDAVFLAALAGPDRFTSVTSTHGSEDMIEREFDHHT